MSLSLFIVVEGLSVEIFLAFFLLEGARGQATDQPESFNCPGSSKYGRPPVSGSLLSVRSTVRLTRRPGFGISFLSVNVRLARRPGFGISSSFVNVRLARRPGFGIRLWTV